MSATLQEQIAEVRDLLEWLKANDSTRVPTMRAVLLTLMELDASQRASSKRVRVQRGNVK